MTFPVNKALTGIENVYALIQHTWPDHADLLNEDNVTVTRGTVTDPATGTITLTISASSPKITGITEVSYTLANLENLSVGELVASDVEDAAQQVSTIVNNNIPCLPSEVVVGDLVNTDGGWTVSLSATEGAFTVTGSVTLDISVGGGGTGPGDGDGEGDGSGGDDGSGGNGDDGGGEEEALGDGSDWGYGELFDKTDNRPTPAVAGTWFEDQYGLNYTPASSVELKTIVSNYLTAEDPGHIATITAGGQTHDIPLNNIDIRLITETKSLFAGASDFNQDIGRWDMSNVTDVGSMFDGCSKFNRYIGDWDVSKVNRFRNTFFGCTEFNQDLSKWDVSSATSMDYMFKSCNAFGQDLSGWCVPKIANMPTDFSNGTQLVLALRPVWGTCPVRPPVDEPVPGERPAARSGHWYKYKGEMFYVAKSKSELEEIVEPYLYTSDPHHVAPLTRVSQTHSIPLNNIDTRFITDLSKLFQDKATFNQDISGWDVSNVTKMQFTFSNAASFNQDISGWDVSKVTGFESILEGATSFNQDIGKWDVSGVGEYGLFKSLKGASSFNQDLSGWCVSKIKSPAHEFNLNGILPPEYMPVWGTCPPR